MEAINFKKLLREERRRCRLERIDPNLSDGGANGNETLRLLSPPSRAIKTSFSSATAIDRPNSSESDPAQDMSSILRANNSHQMAVVDNTRSTSQEKHQPREVELKRGKQPAWPHAPGFLSLSNSAALTSICEDPATISYSRTPLVQDSNGLSTSPSSGSGDGNVSKSASAALEDWLRRLPSGESGLCEWKTMRFGKRRVCMYGEDFDRDAGGGISSLPPPLQEIADQLVSTGVFPRSAPPNHVLLNEYQPGQGILPHTDGPLYESRTATLSLSSSVVIEFTKRRSAGEIGVTTAVPSSLERCRNHDTTTSATNALQGAPAPSFMPSSQQQLPLQVLLEPGSLLLFEDDAYLNYCHGIAMDVLHDETTERCLNAPPHQFIPRGVRYSLTFRHKKKNPS
jgi:2OG-Fe(II) oxygenase superfamily